VNLFPQPRLLRVVARSGESSFDCLNPLPYFRAKQLAVEAYSAQDEAIHINDLAAMSVDRK
jgi:hypothetical protein